MAKGLNKGVLVVMDNSTLEVHTYPTKMKQDSEYYIDEVINHGHNDGDVNWMVVKNFKLIEH